MPLWGVLINSSAFSSFVIVFRRTTRFRAFFPRVNRLTSYKTRE
jgi:hypothetical protein